MNPNDEPIDWDKEVSKHMEPLLRFVTSSGFLSEEDGRDVVQDTFLGAFRSIDRFVSDHASKATFGTWLFGIAHHKLMDRITLNWRTKDTISIESIPEAVKIVGQIDDGRRDAEPAATVLKKELLRILDEELAALPEELRVVLHLKHIAGKTCDEIATITEQKSSTVHGRIQMGREKLRQRLKDRGMFGT
jgi:RNA polymerase sigma-70 factor (ECF subfamily)